MTSQDAKTLPTALIVNTRSRKGERLFAAAKQALEDASFNLVAVYPVQKPSELIATVERALADGAELIVLGSGDGTVSEVIDSLAHHKAILGFLPLGTTNNFARTLGIPLEFKDAADTLVNGKVVKVNLGLVNDDYFANVCAVGLSASIAGTVSHRHKRWFGRAAYALAGLRALLRQRPFQAEITDDAGRHRHIMAWQIVIGNGRFHAGRPLAHTAHITNSSLTVYSIEGTSRLRLARALFAYWRGTDEALPYVTYLQTTHVTITADPTQKAEIDGELKVQTPLQATVAPGALKIIVPTNFEENSAA